ncbi:MAG: PHB depolymerase family esterase [Pseudomonadota bacterium]|nr:PHB depolymerase family esterase [Pseudomonadota bacterium]
MNDSPIDMNEVTRLTREGRLDEAMALLQSRPGVAQPTHTATGPDAAATGVAHGDRRSAPPALAKVLSGLADRLGLHKRNEPRAHAAPAGQSGPAPQGARFETRRFSAAAGSRNYRLYVPASYGGGPAPLVVMLHGCTQSAEDFATGTRMNEVAEAHGALVAYPEQPQSANPNRCWNWFNSGDQQRDQGEPSLIAGIAREVIAEFEVAEGRVYVAGLSAGGAGAAVLGTLYPDLFAAVGVHSGLASGAARDAGTAFAAMRQGAPAAALSSRAGKKVVPTIVFHGDRDRTVSPINGAQVITQARAGTELAATSTRGQATGGVEFTRTVQSDAGGTPVLEHWEIHGAGHAWSGGDPRGSHTVASGPDASREMMRFFLQSARSTAA